MLLRRLHTTPSARAAALLVLNLLEFIRFYYHKQCKYGHTVTLLQLPPKPGLVCLEEAGACGSAFDSPLPPVLAVSLAV